MRVLKYRFTKILILTIAIIQILMVVSITVFASTNNEITSQYKKINKDNIGEEEDTSAAIEG